MEHVVITGTDICRANKAFRVDLHHGKCSILSGVCSASGAWALEFGLCLGYWNVVELYFNCLFSSISYDSLWRGSNAMTTRMVGRPNKVHQLTSSPPANRNTSVTLMSSTAARWLGPAVIRMYCSLFCSVFYLQTSHLAANLTLLDDRWDQGRPGLLQSGSDGVGDLQIKSCRVSSEVFRSSRHQLFSWIFLLNVFILRPPVPNNPTVRTSSIQDLTKLNYFPPFFGPFQCRFPCI